MALAPQHHRFEDAFKKIPKQGLNSSASYTVDHDLFDYAMKRSRTPSILLSRDTGGDRTNYHTVVKSYYSLTKYQNDGIFMQ
mmetsp:Transcript_12693/g.26209  ORF Transcript_12693/g.26209 Transcript_12693/m.26209 type:complete len:82 (+) Transcript_12693:784-1029(+)